MRARVFISSGLAVAVWVSAVGAQSGPGADPVQLPARRVILYKSGVGYFEHVGNVTGSREVAIQFTSGQLNDVLKSLTALDLDNGQISAINYNSVAPIDQRLRALRMPLGSRADALQFYNALRGARVDVRSPAGTIDGRLLGVERKTRTVDGRAEEVDTLTVVAASGAVRSVMMGPEVTIRIGEQDLRDEISRYLAVVASGRDADVRRMVLNATGTGTRRLFVSYISEVPIWKSTYRLVLPETVNDKPRLQGWAIVDNTIGEDWTNVELSLVAGAPQSFIQEISQPYYSRRPVVALPQTVVLGPQTHAAPIQVGTGTLRGVARDVNGAVLPGARVQLFDSANRPLATATTDGNGAFTVTAPVGTHRVTMDIPGFTSYSQAVSVSLGTTTQIDATMRVGALQERLTVAGETSRGGGVAAGRVEAAPPPPPAALQAAPTVTQADRAAAFQLAANAQDLGDLFEYRLDQPVTIRKDQSAMVPIVNAPIDAERVSLWNRPQGSGRPLRAVWLTNSTALTLDGGTFSVVDARAFAGEGIVEPLKPGEKRLVSYGTDLAVQVDARNTTEARRYVRVTARRGVMMAEMESRSEWTYRVRNEDPTPRTLIIEHPARAGWAITPGGPRPDETTPSALRFRLQVGARSEAALVVPERQVNHLQVSVGAVDDNQLRIYAEGGLDAEAIRRALRPIRDKQAQLQTTAEQLEELTQQEQTLVSDQARLRENMKALRGSAEERALTLRYTRQLGALEDRLAVLREEMAAARKAQATQLAELEALVGDWEFELIAR